MPPLYPPKFNGVDLYVSLPLIFREQASSYPGLSVQILFPPDMVHLGKCHKVKGRDEMTHGGYGGASPDCFGVFLCLTFLIFHPPIYSGSYFMPSL